MTTSDPVFFEGLGRAVHAVFNFSLECLGEPGVDGSGHLMGWCENAIVQGTIADPNFHEFDGTWAFFNWPFIGPGVRGNVLIAEDAFAGHSCRSGAKQFVIETGSLAFT